MEYLYDDATIRAKLVVSFDTDDERHHVKSVEEMEVYLETGMRLPVDLPAIDEGKYWTMCRWVDAQLQDQDEQDELSRRWADHLNTQTPEYNGRGERES